MEHLVRSSSFQPRFPEDGVYVGQHLALSFDQELVKRFFERMAKALLHHTYGTGFIRCEVISSNVISGELQQSFETFKPTSHGTLGDAALTILPDEVALEQNLEADDDRVSLDN